MKEKTLVWILIKFCMGKSRDKLIDSSVIMALFNLEDRQHQKALELFETIEKENWRIKISCITIIEIVSLMKYRRIEGWQEYAESLMDGSLFLVDSSYAMDKNDLAWQLLVKEENIGMVDAIEIEHCLTHGEGLLSFDKKQNEVWEKMSLERNLNP